MPLQAASKLQNLGECKCKWIESFMIGKRETLVGQAKSSSILVSSGAPQGNCIGPISFSIYTNDLPSVIKIL